MSLDISTRCARISIPIRNRGINTAYRIFLSGMVLGGVLMSFKEGPPPKEAVKPGVSGSLP